MPSAPPWPCAPSRSELRWRCLPAAVLVAHPLQSLKQSMRDEVEQLKQMHQVKLAAQQQEYETSLRMQQRLREEV